MMIANGSDSLVWKFFIIESEQEVYSMVTKETTMSSQRRNYYGNGVYLGSRRADLLPER